MLACIWNNIWSDGSTELNFKSSFKYVVEFSVTVNKSNIEFIGGMMELKYLEIIVEERIYRWTNLEEME